jgi:hypothetical protein
MSISQLINYIISYQLVHCNSSVSTYNVCSSPYDSSPLQYHHAHRYTYMNPQMLLILALKASF